MPTLLRQKKNNIELNRLVKNGETKKDQLKPVSWIVDMKLSLQGKIMWLAIQQKELSLRFENWHKNGTIFAARINNDIA